MGASGMEAELLNWVANLLTTSEWGVPPTGVGRGAPIIYTVKFNFYAVNCEIAFVC